ncbi:hypothetical protein [Sedimentitalea sp.]|uniref:hypothetical protein n=1 Tax=Sedimentitalea sp. TaxID=2048915 RepID=UPI003296D770
MSYRFQVIIIVMTLAGSPAMAERDLVPSLSSQRDVCADRPSEPDWMQSIGVREAYKRVLVQDIYRAQNIERIVTSGSCACDIRFPTWDAADVEFHERFVAAERWEMLEASSEYNRRADAHRLEAMTICKAEGNW